jgi:gliding motility-associated-like protein
MLRDAIRQSKGKYLWSGTQFLHYFCTMVPFFHRSLLLLYLTCWGTGLFAQGYLKVLEKPERSYDRKILRLHDGDIVTGDASLKGLTLEDERGIYMTRLDGCGNEVWAKRYSWKQNILEFKGFVRNEADDIFILGRAFESPNEFTFLLKLNKEGKPLQFRFFHGGTIDQSTFHLDHQSGKLLVTGLLLDWQVLKEGFLAVFDESLTQVWGTKITPFESDGNAILVENGAVVCRTGPYLLCVNAQKNIDWSVKIENAFGAFPVFGPLDTGDGYLLEINRNGYSFFYKMNKEGQLLWQSPRFRSSGYGADVIPLEDGTFFVTYSQPGTNETFLCRMLLSPQGEIISQHRIVADQSFTSGTIDADLFDNATVNVVANGDLFTGNSNNSGFLLQFPIDSLHDQCFYWEPFSDLLPTDALLVIAPYAMELPPLTLTQQDPTIVAVTADNLLREICDLRTVSEVQQDTLLQCGDNWLVTLPDPSIRWADQYTGASRVLVRPGTYKASNNNCVFPVTYSYQLSREACPCPVYLPNIFSPDLHGYDDRLQLFSQCPLETRTMRVFNRWGQVVFETLSPDGFWNGKVNNRPLPPDVYMVQVIYSWTDESGKLQQGMLAQDVTLVR